MSTIKKVNPFFPVAEFHADALEDYREKMPSTPTLQDIPEIVGDFVAKIAYTAENRSKWYAQKTKGIGSLAVNQFYDLSKPGVCGEEGVLGQLLNIAPTDYNNFVNILQNLEARALEEKAGNAKLVLLGTAIGKACIDYWKAQVEDTTSTWQPYFPKDSAGIAYLETRWALAAIRAAVSYGKNGNYLASLICSAVASIFDLTENN